MVTYYARLVLSKQFDNHAFVRFVDSAFHLAKFIKLGLTLNFQIVLNIWYFRLYLHLVENFGKALCRSYLKSTIPKQKGIPSKLMQHVTFSLFIISSFPPPPKNPTYDSSRQIGGCSTTIGQYTVTPALSEIVFVCY